jgi:C-terminal processing protease CtpA/Prc
LTNERSYSASSDLAALIKTYYRGAVVGRETGSGFYQMNAKESPQLRLPNSWIVVQYPLEKIVFVKQPDERIPWGRGVLPDFPVLFSLEELAFVNGDSILNYTLQLIQNGVYIEKPVLQQDDMDAKKNNWVIYMCTITLVTVLFLVFHRKSSKQERR